MPSPTPETMPQTVIELTVANHAGVMSHICGLFARRAFNLEGILCGPLREDHEHSRVLLLVNEDRRLGQLVRELERLYDVSAVRLRDDLDAEQFTIA